MADKSFGVKDINLIGASGTPTIESPNNLNINAVNVAISTDITVAGKVSLGAGTSISSPGSNILTFGTNSTERLRIDSSGNLSITNGNLVLSTSGKGIDFSATADGSGTTTSELLNDYEEGTFTPSVSSSSGTITSTGTPSGRYVKIGRLVTVHFIITITNAGTANGAYLDFGNLPFTSSNTHNIPGVCREQSINGFLSTAQITGNNTGGRILRYDNSGVIVSGGNYQCTITYEAQ